MIDTPEHYDMKIQPIEFIMANGLGFCEGNILKYISRYKQKGGVSDLYKAHYYLELLIDHIEENLGDYKLPTPSEEMEQLEKKKAIKIAANKVWASVVEKDAKEDKREYEPLQDPNYMQGFNYCETCKTHHLANRDGW